MRATRVRTVSGRGLATTRTTRACPAAPAGGVVTTRDLQLRARAVNSTCATPSHPRAVTLPWPPSTFLPPPHPTHGPLGCLAPVLASELAPPPRLLRRAIAPRWSFRSWDSALRKARARLLARPPLLLPPPRRRPRATRLATPRLRRRRRLRAASLSARLVTTRRARRLPARSRLPACRRPARR